MIHPRHQAGVELQLDKQGSSTLEKMPADAPRAETDPDFEPSDDMDATIEKIEEDFHAGLIDQAEAMKRFNMAMWGDEGRWTDENIAVNSAEKKASWTDIGIAGYLQGYLPKTAAKKTPGDEERRVQAALNVLHRTVYDAPSIETEYDAGGVSLEELEEVARAWKNSQLPEFRRERYPRRAGAYGEEDGVPISYEEILREYKDYYKKKQAIGKTGKTGE